MHREKKILHAPISSLWRASAFGRAHGQHWNAIDLHCGRSGHFYALAPMLRTRPRLSLRTDRLPGQKTSGSRFRKRFPVRGIKAGDRLCLALGRLTE
jgi:hypothetical protein